LLVSLVLALVLVYMVLACQFESLRDPFVVMFSVPLAAIGVILMLFLTDTTLNIQSYIGCIMLGGIVVNNAILLVNQSLLHMREAGMPPREAIREAVRIRVRPVLMTSLTTFFGLLPLALFPGAGSELYRGLASVMLGGLLVASAGTLLLVPCVLGLVVDIRTRLARVVKGGAAVAPSPRQR
jgi:HAE1 family hydrophobic/amphiphilic exporter-1